MTNYYLISERVEGKQISFPSTTGRSRRSKKLVCQNLILPSIHASRSDNLLSIEHVAEQAVTNLKASCSESVFWPSFSYLTKDDDPNITKEIMADSESNVPSNSSMSTNSYYEPTTFVDQEDYYCSSRFKSKIHNISYESLEPRVVHAARNLFFERKKQIVCWGNPPPPLPTEYELFAAWASLPKAEKMNYVAEVVGLHAERPMPSNSVEAQRAVTSLFSSNPDSCSWPSFQFTHNISLVFH